MGMLPATTGSGETSFGVQVARNTGVNEVLVTSALDATPEGLLVIWIGHTLALSGPDFTPMLALIDPCTAVTEADAVFPVPPLVELTLPDTFW